MNKQLQETLDLSEHRCLTGVSSLYTFPFVRSTSVLEGYEFKPGPWVVLLSNMRPAEVLEDDPATRKALIQFCPFCGASLYPQYDVPPSVQENQTKEVPNEETASKGPIRAAAKQPAHRP